MSVSTIKAIVEKIGLPNQAGAYAIHGSAPLYARGLRKEIHDLDIVTDPKVFEELKQRYPDNFGMYGGDERIFFDNLDGWEVEIFKTWWGGMDTKKILRNSENIGGIWFASLDDVLEWKKLRNKPKDQPDIANIEQYLTQNAKTAASRVLMAYLAQNS